MPICGVAGNNQLTLVGGLTHPPNSQRRSRRDQYGPYVACWIQRGGPVYIASDHLMGKTFIRQVNKLEEAIGHCTCNGDSDDLFSRPFRGRQKPTGPTPSRSLPPESRGGVDGVGIEWVGGPLRHDLPVGVGYG